MHGMINCRYIVGKVKFLWSIQKFQNNFNEKTRSGRIIKNVKRKDSNKLFTGFIVPRMHQNY